MPDHVQHNQLVLRPMLRHQDSPLAAARSLLCRPRAAPGDGVAPMQSSSLEETLGDVAQTVTNLFPLWVVLAGGLALWEPTLFTW